LQAFPAVVARRRRQLVDAIMVNQTPPNAANPCRQQAFVPAIVATGDGNAIVVTYYDYRNDTNTPTGFEGTDYFAVICNTGTDCTKAAN
jgi:hypothetical protein